jgi:hypothetical protein
LVVVGATDADVVAPIRVTVDDPSGKAIDLAQDRDARGMSLFARTLLHVAELYETDPAAFNRAFTHHLARSVFVLVPLVALFLRGLYRRSRYVHQLVAALHLQSLAFIAMLAALTIDAVAGGRDGPGGSLAVVAVVAWAFLALRRLHGEGRLRTAVKTGALAVCSLIALIAVMIGTVLVTSLLA